MGYATYLRELLKPLGVYELSASSFSGGELEALGAGLDENWQTAQLQQRESVVMTAEDTGLEAYESLFRNRPAATGVEARRAAIAALLQIGDDSFTLAALTRCLAGCGAAVAVTETGTPGTVTVSFPDLLGQPPQWETVQTIIEDILPCHLQINYQFRYRTWGDLLQMGLTWAQAAELSWAGLAGTGS
ncbi:MAG: DUF2313 domain-containing protein [Clostridiales bacterium]|nr:DUF2313 domain-containing protein [Clostridiales bacterium]